MPDPSKAEPPLSPTEKILALLPLKEREAARIVLSRQDVESIQLLARWKGKERERKSFRRSIAAGVVGIVGVLLNMGSRMGPAWIPTVIWLFTALGATGLVGLTLSPVDYFPTRMEKAVLEAFLQSENVWSVGPLLDYLHQLPPSQRAQVLDRLILLLPRLNQATAPPLTPQQRGSLHGILDHMQRDSNPELRLAVLGALQEIGDWSCLGAVYLLATGEAFTGAAQSVRDTAQICLDHLSAHLNFGFLYDLPKHIENVASQMRATDSVDFMRYATSILTLKQLLRQLTPANYQRILSERQRDRLYSLTVQYPALEGGMHRYRKRDLHLEIVSTAERLGDTRAIKAFQAFAHNPPATADKQVVEAMTRAIETLEPLIQREKASQTLLRGASAPDLLPDELLRAATPNASETDPAELLRATSAYQEQGAFKIESIPEEKIAVVRPKTGESDD